MVAKTNETIHFTIKPLEDAALILPFKQSFIPELTLYSSMLPSIL
jgi:hypothetical protein